MYKRFNVKLIASLLIVAMAFLMIGAFPAQANTQNVTLNGTTVEARIVGKARLVKGEALGNVLNSTALCGKRVGVDFLEIKYVDKVLYLVSGSRVAFLTTGVGTKSPSIKTVALSAQPRTIGRGGDAQIFVPFNDVIKLLGGSFSGATTASLPRTTPPNAAFAFTGTDKRDVVPAVDNARMIGRGATFANSLYGRVVSGSTNPANAWIELYKNASQDLENSKLTGTGPFDLGYNSYNIDGSAVTAMFGGGSTGSGAGIDAVRARQAHFGGSDSITDIPVGDRNFYAIIPVAMGGVAVNYKLPGNPELRLTPQVIADIYMGKISKWNDRRITALNPNAQLPNADIQVVYRQDASGTTEIFATYLRSVSRVWAEKYGVTTKMGDVCGYLADGETSPGTIPYSRRKDIAGGSGIRDYIKGHSGASGLASYPIGYVSYGDVAGHDNIGTARVRNRAGNFVTPLSAAVFAAGITHKDMYSHPVNGRGAGAYPITGFTWLIVEKDASVAKPDFDSIGGTTPTVVSRPALDGTTSAVAAEGKPITLAEQQQSATVIKDFVRWAVVEGFGDEHAMNRNYTPITPNLKLHVAKMLDTIK
ncbi:MAG: substrate-binding domain-containing protein [Clostridiales bacterium]|jgi:phosphate transport system substrate-binding protein|nr:substrate-binding domain-containing protein [Clostridiales bacterium]